MELTLTWQLLLTLPFLVAGMLYGWRRGWREEAITAAILLVALLFFGNNRLADSLGVLVNRVLQAFALFFSALFGGEIVAPELVNANNAGLFRFVGFLLFVGMGYVIGGALGQRTLLTRTGRLVGSILGVLNVFLIASQLWAYLQRFLPDVFQRESSIRVTPDPEGAVLRGYLPSIFALLLLLLLIMVFLRLPKIRQ
ncbi:MAG TPA: hypothetical protein VLA19_03980 [Herpetosiphonaceae bacterium]|nr:hypothetical protein [Herpetosiphonaceae bacterium]